MKIWRMCILGYIPKSTKTHPQHTQYLLLFHCNNGCKNASQCYITSTLTVLLHYLLPTKHSYRNWQSGYAHHLFLLKVQSCYFIQRVFFIARLLAVEEIAAGWRPMTAPPRHTTSRAPFGD